MKQHVAGIDALQVVDAALGAFADLVYDSRDEDLFWLYVVARDALKSAQKEDLLSYEDRSAPHQYYIESVPSQAPLKQPLRVPHPDVTMRGVGPTSRPGIS